MKVVDRAIQIFLPLKYRLLRAIQWSILGTGIAQAVYLLASIVIARRLGNEDFGRLGLIQFTLNTLVLLIATSFGWSVMRTAATMHEHEREAFSSLLNSLITAGILVSAGLSVLILLLGPMICTFWFSDPVSIPAFQIVAISVLFSGYFSLIVSLFSGLEAFRQVALLNITRGLLLGIIMTVGSKWGGLIGAGFGFTLASGISAFVAWFIMRRVLKQYHLALCSHNWRHAYHVLTHISLPSFLSTIIGSLSLWAGSVLLARHPDGLHQVAVFNASNQWKSVLLFAPTQISQASVPIMANLWSKNELVKFKAVVRSNLLLMLLTYGLPSVPILAFSSHILHLYLLSGEEETKAMQFLILSGLMSALCGVLGYAMVAMGKTWQALAVNTLWTVVFLMMALLWFSHGALGICKSYFVAYFVLFDFTLFYVFYMLSKHGEVVR
jgi:O-antigen/teichoic acid export membrane protein